MAAVAAKAASFSLLSCAAASRKMIHHSGGSTSPLTPGVGAGTEVCATISPSLETRAAFSALPPRSAARTVTVVIDALSSSSCATWLLRCAGGNRCFLQDFLDYEHLVITWT